MPHHTSQLQAHSHSHAGAEVHGHPHTPGAHGNFIRQWQHALVIALLVLVSMLVGGVYLAGWGAQSTAGRIGAILLGLLGLGGLIVICTRSLVMHLMMSSHSQGTGEQLTQQREIEGHTLHRPRSYDFSLVFGMGMILGGERRFRKAVVGLTQMQPGDKVLDVGSGSGTTAIVAARLGKGEVAITGIDASPEMVAHAKEKADRAGVQVDFRRESVDSMSFEDGTFDVVMNTFVMHHLPGDLKHRGLAEMRRVLKPAGRLVIVEFEPPKSPMGKLLLSLVMGPQMMHIVTDDLKPLLRDAGFVDIESGRAGNRLATFVSARKAA